MKMPGPVSRSESGAHMKIKCSISRFVRVLLKHSLDKQSMDGRNNRECQSLPEAEAHDIIWYLGGCHLGTECRLLTSTASCRCCQSDHDEQIIVRPNLFLFRRACPPLNLNVEDQGDIVSRLPNNIEIWRRAAGAWGG